ncbi:hypothetical protein MIR68_000905 [Amoeboaphelidium protococcarum]|nr:hypothetical protein MIR68_000905 [Amoeboaphelidium protococcarum]
MSCCMPPKWKRETVVDHKFSYIDVHEFRGKDSVFRRLKYAFLYVLAFKGFMLYVADISSIIFQFLAADKAVTFAGGDPRIVEFFKYIYLFSVLASLALLLIDFRKARKIIKSQDISFTFTNEIAYRYYAFKKYDYFCFFEEINDMKRFKDTLSLFVFFRLRGWKRLIFAETPRAGINMYWLVLVLISLNYQDGQNALRPYMEDNRVFVLLLLVALAVLIYLFSAFSHLIAVIIYIPMICEIRGNLKEYCCHKVDKRIAQLIAKNESRKAEQAQLSAYKNKKSNTAQKQLLQYKKKMHNGNNNFDGKEPKLPDIVDDIELQFPKNGYISHSDTYSDTDDSTNHDSHSGSGGAQSARRDTVMLNPPPPSCTTGDDDDEVGFRDRDGFNYNTDPTMKLNRNIPRKVSDASGPSSSSHGDHLNAVPSQRHANPPYNGRNVPTAVPIAPPRSNTSRHHGNHAMRDRINQPQQHRQNIHEMRRVPPAAHGHAHSRQQHRQVPHQQQQQQQQHHHHSQHPQSRHHNVPGDHLTSARSQQHAPQPPSHRAPPPQHSRHDNRHLRELGAHDNSSPSNHAQKGGNSSNNNEHHLPSNSQRPRGMSQYQQSRFR